ncbi:MAG: helix-turn-helix domain-containing protein [Proteiniphilum sp.]|uniref:helix-turn-helix domain-containing protein n=2 Tax=Proteiniphilum sp. TaxID=1926877 RepID=UPI0009265BF9|nr:helix-turn-helix domain-containing protein [Proteiniphilum sp.]MEA5127952.1 helix-turn-helix domain-containing protein [Proteiniphilum sp.]OJV81626.1 MAG: hypothetical protein BGO34_09420 [Bacteroidia bacterium 44-10]
MTLFQQIDRMKYIHHLISKERTGNPEYFACKLQLSKRQLFNILEEMRILGLDIRYSKMRETYYYNGDKYLDISYSLKELSEEEVENIYAGMIFFPKCNFISLYPANFTSVI